MLVATYMRSLQGRGDLKTLVSSGSRYSSAVAFAFFIQAVSWYVCLGLLPSIGRSGLLFKWQRLARRIRRHLHWSAALLLVTNAAALDPRIAVKRRTRMRSRWWGARFVLQAARQRISKDHTAATDVKLAWCFRRC